MDRPPISPRTFAIVLATLAGLTLATVGLSFLPLGRWHLAAGLAIGALKAALVALVFMQLIRSPSRIWLAAGVGVFWLGILVALTMSDYLTRGVATL